MTSATSRPRSKSPTADVSLHSFTPVVLPMAREISACASKRGRRNGKTPPSPATTTTKMKQTDRFVIDKPHGKLNHSFTPIRSMQNGERYRSSSRTSSTSTGAFALDGIGEDHGTTIDRRLTSFPPPHHHAVVQKLTHHNNSSGKNHDYHFETHFLHQWSDSEQRHVCKRYMEKHHCETNDAGYEPRITKNQVKAFLLDVCGVEVLLQLLDVTGFGVRFGGGDVEQKHIREDLDELLEKVLANMKILAGTEFDFRTTTFSEREFSFVFQALWKTLAS
ncbi:unnamed protein product [Amoebophrya sp. A120]|nr:unnamed protein product [Amoebophrya sp. A120]|eukprot:GSA120T00021141001.1